MKKIEAEVVKRLQKAICSGNQKPSIPSGIRS